jgi:hypothetical protein
MPVSAPSALEAVLAPGGSLERALPGYEPRPDQLRMAVAVADALARRRYLVAEAGTGTGKTLAYLLPAVQSGRRVVISTATRTLQEQIWFRDIPLLRERCGVEISAAYLKGRANYYCIARGEEFERHPTFPTREEAALWPRIREWARTTDTGDRAEIDLPDSYLAWKDLSATGETCIGKECAAWEDCFVQQARGRAAGADVVLVNHHLFFADLAMRTSRAGVEVLPPYEAVIFDEAHAIEDVATEYFGLQVSSYRVEELARDAQRTVADRPDLASMLKRTTGELSKAGERFFGSVARALAGGTGRPEPPRGGRRPEEENLRGPLLPAMLAPLAGEQDRLDVALEELRSEICDDPAPALQQIARRAAELRVELAAVTAMKEPSRVFFAEARGRGVFLRAAPIDVAEEIATRLYRNVDTAIFTSATLATQGRFDYFRRQVGLRPELDVDERVFPGPFDYATQAARFRGRRREGGAGARPGHRRPRLRALHVGPQHARLPGGARRPALAAPAPGRAPQAPAAGGVPRASLGALRDPELLGGGRRARCRPLARGDRPAPLRAAGRSGGGGPGEGARRGRARRLLRTSSAGRGAAAPAGLRAAGTVPRRSGAGGRPRPPADDPGLRPGLPGLPPAEPAPAIDRRGAALVGTLRRMRNRPSFGRPVEPLPGLG